MSGDIRGSIGFITNSEGRLDVLEILHGESFDQTEIVDQCSTSRKTVQRCLSDLIEQDWIEECGDQYEQTSVGELIYREYTRLRSPVSQSEGENESEPTSIENLREDVAFLAGSEIRPQVLRTLREQPARQSEMVRRLSTSRTTIHRCIRNFEERGWVRKNADRGLYELTPSGETLLHMYDEFVDAVGIIDEAEPFLASLIHDQLTIPIEVIDGGHISVASQDEPHAAIMDFLQHLRFEDAARFRSMTPVVSAVYNEEIGKYVGSDIQMELIIDESLLDPTGSEPGVEAENLDLYVHPNQISFGLVIFNDEMAMMGAFDEEGNHRAGLVSENDVTVEWMIEVYESYKQEAELLTDHPEEMNP